MTTRTERVDRITAKLTGLYGAVCCHRTGGKNDDPDCECRKVARDIEQELFSRTDHK